MAASIKNSGMDFNVAKTDLAISDVIIPNSRISYDEISEVTGFSSKTISKVLYKLQEKQILHPTISWEPKNLGSYVPFYLSVYVKSGPDQIEKHLLVNHARYLVAESITFENRIGLTINSDHIYKMDSIADQQQVDSLDS